MSKPILIGVANKFLQWINYSNDHYVTDVNWKWSYLIPQSFVSWFIGISYVLSGGNRFSTFLFKSFLLTSNIWPWNLTFFSLVNNWSMLFSFSLYFQQGPGSHLCSHLIIIWVFLVIEQLAWKFHFYVLEFTSDISTIISMFSWQVRGNQVTGAID